MDPRRPAGPRDDQRNVAFQSIFGRPSAQHHQHHNPQYPQQYQQQYQSAQYYNPYTNAAPPLPPQHPQYRQSHYSQHPGYPQQQHAQQYNVYQQQHQHPGPHLGAPSMHSRDRSIAGSIAPGVIVPQPQEPPDASLEPYISAGMTQAQAYQAQINVDGNGVATAPPPGHHANWPMNGARRSESPMLPPLPSDNGRLGIDFTSEDVHSEDVSGSELPWASSSRAQSLSPTESNGSGSPQWPRGPRRSSASAAEATRPYPLQVNTILSSTPESRESPASSIFSHDRGDSLSSHTTARRSSESTRTLPYPASVRRERTAQDRAQSLSLSSTVAHSMRDLTRASSKISHLSNASPRPRTPPTSRRAMMPIVYPAIISRVAETFRQHISLSERVKDGLTYTDAFDGREAVDKIAFIIKTSDRNLALLLGRALDAQKFFHDVTYDRRLRDSAAELYQFQTKLSSPFVSGELNGDGAETGDDATSTVSPSMSSHVHPASLDEETLVGTGTESESAVADSSIGHDVGGNVTPPASSTSPRPPVRKGSTSSDEVALPSGVFTLLTDCYSATCNRDRLCYSISCPRRLEQQTRLHLKQEPILGGLKKHSSVESLHDVLEGGSLWINSVSEDVANSVSDMEKKRQETINEVIYTEKHFVRDMEYLRDEWMMPLSKSDIIPEDRRKDFVEQVFWNVTEIIEVNTRLRDSLSKRQKQSHVVERIGDLFLAAIPCFGPFVKYGAHQLYGKFEFEKEKSNNPEFARFVDEVERLPISRKLELNGYLTKPTTRLARYPLLLEAVLKHTSEDNPDKIALQQAVTMVREFLTKVNVETGKTENRFSLLQLSQQLVFRPEDKIDLRLTDQSRELIFKGNLSKRAPSGSEAGDLQVFLFDHALLMVKQRAKQGNSLVVYRRPIPLELLLIAASNPEEQARNRGKPLLRRSSFNRNSPHAVPIPAVKTDAKGGYAITFVHLGRKFYQMMLWSPTYITQKKWVEHITKQQDIIRERSLIFDTTTLSEGFFVGVNHVNCATPFNGGRRMAYGTDDGVYFSDFNDRREPIKVLALYEVAQIEILEEYQLLIVLSERQVMTFPLDALDPMDPEAGLKRAKKISSHTTFFRSGVVFGKTLVCVVKASPLSSTIKVLEPIDSKVRGTNKPTFRKLLQGGNDTLRVYKEFYIPVESSSLHFMKSRLCIGCTKGFEIVDLDTLDAQSLLDNADPSLAFAVNRENIKPISIFRLGDEFLLCYEEYGFYIARNGWRARKQFMVHWEGTPTAFAFRYPYVLAFDPTFVEIRNVETGLLSQVIQGNNLRCLFSEPDLLRLNQQFGYSAQPAYGGYTQSYGNPYQPPQQPLPAFTKDEVLIVSDDRVMTLRMIAPPPAAAWHPPQPQGSVHGAGSVHHDPSLYMLR